MYIKEIKIINIRSYENSSLIFSKGINILIGKNNSGKSTIIKTIYQIQKNQCLSIADIRKGNNKGFIQIVLDEITEDNKSSFKNANPSFRAFLGSIIVSTIYSDPKSDTPLQAHYYPKDKVIEVTKEGRFKVVNMVSSQQGNNFVGVSNNESENNFIYPFLSKRKNNSYASRIDLKDIHQVDDDFRFLIAKIKKLSNPGHPRNDEFLAQCLKILGFKIGIIPEDNQQENIGIFVNDSDLISIQQMGDGVIHIVGLIAMLLTENHKLYLIEELENDLHPEALKALLDLIITKSTSNQFIISTHSNIVLRYLGSQDKAKIFETSIAFKETFNNLKIPTSEITETKNTPESRIILLEKLGYEPWDFELYKSYLILEESSAETIIRDFLIPEFIPQIQNKIKTIAANGIDDLSPRFYDFLRLFVFIHLNSIYYKKAWVIADGDQVGLAKIDELKKQFNSWPPNHFRNFKKSNLEDYYPSRFSNKVLAIQMISDKKVKRDKKRELTKEVIEWITTEPKLAKEEFEISAEEIINILKEISLELNN